LLLVGKNLHVIGTKVGSLYDTTKALEFAAQVKPSDTRQAHTTSLTIPRANSSLFAKSSRSQRCPRLLTSFEAAK
jgi:hypothetical protein